MILSSFLKRYFSLLFLTLFIVFPNSGYSMSLTILNPCQEGSLVQRSFIFDSKTTLGLITTSLLKNQSIPFVGDETSIISILSFPEKERDLEIISNEEMRAYGWCYSLNGKILDKLASEVHFSEANNIESLSVVWFLGYAEYKRGVWTSYCEPLKEIHKHFLCNK